MDSFPLPHMEEMFANLCGATEFSTLDLQTAYHQVTLPEDSRNLMRLSCMMDYLVSNGFHVDWPQLQAVSRGGCLKSLKVSLEHIVIGWHHGRRSNAQGT